MKITVEVEGKDRESILSQILELFGASRVDAATVVKEEAVKATEEAQEETPKAEPAKRGRKPKAPKEELAEPVEEFLEVEAEVAGDTETINYAEIRDTLRKRVQVGLSFDKEAGDRKYTTAIKEILKAHDYQTITDVKDADLQSVFDKVQALYQ